MTSGPLPQRETRPLFKLGANPSDDQVELRLSPYSALWRVREACCLRLKPAQVQTQGATKPRLGHSSLWLSPASSRPTALLLQRIRHFAPPEAERGDCDSVRPIWSSDNSDQSGLTRPARGTTDHTDLYLQTQI